MEKPSLVRRHMEAPHPMTESERSVRGRHTGANCACFEFQHRLIYPHPYLALPTRSISISGYFSVVFLSRQVADLTSDGRETGQIRFATRRTTEWHCKIPSSAEPHTSAKCRPTRQICLFWTATVQDTSTVKYPMGAALQPESPPHPALPLVARQSITLTRPR